MSDKNLPLSVIVLSYHFMQLLPFARASAEIVYRPSE